MFFSYKDTKYLWDYQLFYKLFIIPNWGITMLSQHHCPATAILLSCYGNIILLLFNALSWLFSGLVVKLIEPIKVKKRVSIVRLCEKTECFIVRLCEKWGVYAADYVKNGAFIVWIMWKIGVLMVWIMWKVLSLHI